MGYVCKKVNGTSVPTTMKPPTVLPGYCPFGYIEVGKSKFHLGKAVLRVKGPLLRPMHWSCTRARQAVLSTERRACTKTGRNDFCVMLH